MAMTYQTIMTAPIVSDRAHLIYGMRQKTTRAMDPERTCTKHVSRCNLNTAEMEGRIVVLMCLIKIESQRQVEACGIFGT